MDGTSVWVCLCVCRRFDQIAFFFLCTTHLSSLKRSIILCPTNFSLRYGAVNLTVDAVLDFGCEMFWFWCNVNRCRFHYVMHKRTNQRMEKEKKREWKRMRKKKTGKWKYVNNVQNVSGMRLNGQIFTRNALKWTNCCCCFFIIFDEWICSTHFFFLPCSRCYCSHFRMLNEKNVILLCSTNFLQPWMSEYWCLQCLHLTIV